MARPPFFRCVGTLLLAHLAGCGGSKGDSADAGAVQLDNVVETELVAGNSLVVGKATQASGGLPEAAGGPTILDVHRTTVGVPDSAAIWTVTLDSPADTVMLQFDGEDTVHRFEASGTEARLVFHYRGAIRDAWQDRFASSRDRFCDGNRFVVPDDIPPNSRYTEFYDSMGSTLDLLCSGGSFDAGSFVDDQTVNLLFPKRATGPVSLVAVADGTAGEAWEVEQAVQRVKEGGQVVSLFFDAATDLDLHVDEPDGTEIYYGNPSSDAGGTLNLDSNPDCSLDHVNNEHIGWLEAPAGRYSVRLSYYQACTQDSVDFVMSTVNGDDIRLYEGTVFASDEGRDYVIAEFER